MKLGRIAFLLLGFGAMFSVAGCGVLGVAAAALPQYVKAAYAGLQGQSVGVLVWADRGTLIDWGTVQLDLANAVQAQLQAAKADELKETTFPVEPRSILRYQRDHPGLEAVPVIEFAGRFGVSRLIYVELSSFGTRSQTDVELFRGSATATIRVIAVDSSGRGSVAYEEEGVTAVFPRKVSVDGLPNLGDRNTYNGIVQALATEVAHRFFTHIDEEL